jgi:transcriptional regulator with AAA-type ATPase domain
VLETERELDARRLAPYLPQDQVSRLPMLLGQGAPDSATAGYSERDLLYKILFDMRRDMTDLKKMVLELATGQRPHEAQELLRQNSHLFNNTAPSGTFEGGQASEYFLPAAPSSYKNEPASEYDDEEAPVEDIPHETEEETLSLDVKEREMILKALKKHNNKRKYAAHDLGISERTLYRKLKQYDLEQV